MFASTTRAIAILLLALATVVGVDALPAPIINGTFVPTAADGATASSAFSGLCVACSVTDVDNAVSERINQAARVSIPVGVLASARVAIDLPETVQAGAAAGFVVRDGTGLLDLTVFQGLTVRTRLDGVVQDERTGASLLKVASLGGSRFSFTLRSTAAFDAIEVEIQGAVTALTAVDVLYGAVRVPQPPTVLVHTASNGASVSTASGPLCVGCTVSNADNTIDGTYRTAAQIRVPLGVLAAQTMTVEFGEDVPRASRTGFVVKHDSGLLSATVLERITLTTLLSGSIVEQVTGSDIGVVNYADGRSYISIRNTGIADQATISMSGAVMLLSELEVFGAASVIRSGPPSASGELNALAFALDTADTFADTPGRNDVDAVPALALGAPAPNPASSGTTRLALRTDGSPARVALYDVLGRQVALLHDGAVAAGGESVAVDASSLRPGAYLVVAETGRGRVTRQMTVVR